MFFFSLFWFPLDSGHTKPTLLKDTDCQFLWARKVLDTKDKSNNPTGVPRLFGNVYTSLQQTAPMLADMQKNRFDTLRLSDSQWRLSEPFPWFNSWMCICNNGKHSPYHQKLRQCRSHPWTGVQENKIGGALCVEGMAVFSPLSIKAPLANRSIWASVCLKGQSEQFFSPAHCLITRHWLYYSMNI